MQDVNPTKRNLTLFGATRASLATLLPELSSSAFSLDKQNKKRNFLLPLCLCFMMCALPVLTTVCLCLLMDLFSQLRRVV